MFQFSGKLKRLLWPNDLSKCSESVLPFVISVAKKYDAEVHVLYVAEDLTQHEPWYGDFDPGHARHIMEWEKKKARERLQQLCRKYLADCAAYAKHVVVGNPAREILKFIKDHDIDIVVMCRKGAGGDFKMGSVAQRVAFNAPVPVMLGPGDSDMSWR